MAAAVSIRFRAQLIGRPNGALNRERSVHRRQSQSATEARFVSRSGWSGRRKGTGEADLRRERKERSAKNRFSKGNSHKSFNQRLLCQRGVLKSRRER